MIAFVCLQLEAFSTQDQCPLLATKRHTRENMGKHVLFSLEENASNQVLVSSYIVWKRDSDLEMRRGMHLGPFFKTDEIIANSTASTVWSGYRLGNEDEKYAIKQSRHLCHKNVVLVKRTLLVCFSSVFCCRLFFVHSQEIALLRHLKHENVCMICLLPSFSRSRSLHSLTCILNLVRHSKTTIQCMLVSNDTLVLTG